MPVIAIMPQRLLLDLPTQSCTPRINFFMSLEQLRAIRQCELKAVLALLRQIAPARARVLDLGAGTGWQSEILAAAGYQMDAIDLPTSVYALDRVFPITEYDGQRIPFADGTFDVVYSSNVLEHVAHAKSFQREIKRVLKSSGCALHLVPSGSWRFWSNLAHYPYMLQQILGRMAPTTGPASDSQDVDQSGARTPVKRTTGFLPLLWRALVPRRDGEIGNAWTELYHLSRWRWRNLFHQTGWIVEQRVSNQLFYTAYYLRGAALTMEARRRLSHWLGGACHVFVLRPTADR
jgi:SAM-dependent methyltransferase